MRKNEFEGEFLPQMQAVVARYLAGPQSLEDAASDLATVMRASFQRAFSDYNAQSLPPKARMKPSLGPAYVEHLPLAPGASAAEQTKASAVFREALVLLMKDTGGDAA